MTIAVIGAADATRDLYLSARWVGRLLAACGAVVVTGGRGGVMEAASRGALAQGGVTIGILPGSGPEDFFF
ncbi:MAG: TIGR00725 family protein, partial [Candidatus Eisenbacteria bacterium]|nr:TIGR00725 family protein [Candidatus Eisenbacteria bacterium]